MVDYTNILNNLKDSFLDLIDDMNEKELTALGKTFDVLFGKTTDIEHPWKNENETDYNRSRFLIYVVRLRNDEGLIDAIKQHFLNSAWVAALTIHTYRSIK